MHQCRPHHSLSLSLSPHKLANEHHLYTLCLKSMSMSMQLQLDGDGPAVATDCEFKLKRIIHLRNCNDRSETVYYYKTQRRTCQRT